MNTLPTQAPEASHGDLEPWSPPAKPPRENTKALWTWVLTAGAPCVVTALGWAAADSGTVHSIGDAIASGTVAAAFTGLGAILRKVAREDHRVRDGRERHTHLLAAFGSLTCAAIGGLTTLFTVSAYTSNVWYRLGYGVVALVAAVCFRLFGDRSRAEQTLAHAQRLELETTAASATQRVEQMRQDGETTRTVTREEHKTIRTRLREDGETARTATREQHATVRAVVEAYAQIATSTPAAQQVAPVAQPSIPPHLHELLSLSSSAADALGADALALLGHSAALNQGQQPAHETPGNYL